MRLADKITQYSGERPFFTLEFFPPKTDQVGISYNVLKIILMPCDSCRASKI